MALANGDRVKLNTDYSPDLLKGSSGVITEVLQKQYEVDFDRDSNGKPINPPIGETVMKSDVDQNA